MKDNYGPGRPPKKETVKQMATMISMIKDEPKIPNAKIARSLNISSLRCATLAKRLAKKSLIVIGKEDGLLVYTSTNG
jgi:Mn-dependent DtxR family transcriptional regulator